MISWLLRYDGTARYSASWFMFRIGGKGIVFISFRNKSWCFISIFNRRRWSAKNIQFLETISLQIWEMHEGYIKTFSLPVQISRDLSFSKFIVYHSLWIFRAVFLRICLVTVRRRLYSEELSDSRWKSREPVAFQRSSHFFQVSSSATFFKRK